MRLQPEPIRIQAQFQAQGRTIQLGPTIIRKGLTHFRAVQHMSHTIKTPILRTLGFVYKHPRLVPRFTTPSNIPSTRLCAGVPLNKRITRLWRQDRIHHPVRVGIWRGTGSRQHFYKRGSGAGP
jgi:hypothetical protein